MLLACYILCMGTTEKRNVIQNCVCGENQVAETNRKKSQGTIHSIRRNDRTKVNGFEWGCTINACMEREFEYQLLEISKYKCLSRQTGSVHIFFGYLCQGILVYFILFFVCVYCIPNIVAHIEASHKEWNCKSKHATEIIYLDKQCINISTVLQCK